MNCRGHKIITRKGTTPVPTMPSGIDAKKSPQKKKVDLFINTLKSTLTLLILSTPSSQKACYLYTLVQIIIEPTIVSILSCIPIKSH